MPPPDPPHPSDEPPRDHRTADRIRTELRFCALYREHAGLCRAVAWSILRHPDDAKDVVQDIFASLWADRHETLNRLGPSYFRTAARNRALDVLKRRQTAHRHRERLRIGARGSSRHAPTDLFAELERRGAYAALDARLANLPEFRRRVALLCLGEGMTSAEAARILGVSEKAVEKQRQKLKRDLRGGGGDRGLNRL